MSLRRRIAIVLPAAIAIAIGYGCRAAEPPFGSVLVTVDTDVAVPRLVSNLRLDVFRDGVWIESREIPLRDARLLPASFGIFTSGSADHADAMLRLRAYGDGALVDAPATPRLVRDGSDVTPPREPDPALAIDQLVRVTLVAGEEQRAHVMLLGACAGVSADVSAALTCTAQGARETAPLASGAGGDAPSLAGTFGQGAVASPAPRAPAGNDDGGEVLVPGGAFVLGSRDLAANRAWAGVPVSSVPPRLVVVSSFLMDRYEVSVGRFRRALARGFVPPALPTANDAPLPAQLSSAAALDAFCTFSTAPRAGADPRAGSREALPLSCVTFATARAFCTFEGGDLPTEAEWEYATTAALRPAKTAYAFGDDDATCEGAVFARTTLQDRETSECVRSGFLPGPGRVGSAKHDVTPSNDPALAIHDLGGNLAEWTRDVYQDYGDVCWSGAPQRDPTCDLASGPRRVTRGGAFTEARGGMFSTLRKPADPALPFAGIGFRCIRGESAR